MSAMTISELGRVAGVGVETVRYYQRRGLLPQPDRTPGSAIRRYGPEDAQRLRFIRAAAEAGFTLEEIGQLLGFDRIADRAAIRALADRRIAALDAEIAALTRARKSLTRLSHECGQGGAGPCPIIEAFLD